MAAIITEPEVLQLTPAGRRWTQDYEWAGHIPVVLHAPQGWQTNTAPDSTRVYFKLTDRPGEIFFSERTLLFTPGNEAFNQGEPAQGWIALPGGQPGLWSFKLGSESKWVEVRNLPPFFAFQNPVHYFEPPIPWVEWISPQAGEAPEDSVPVEFRVHLAGVGEIRNIEVHLGEERIYEGRTVPQDLRIEIPEDGMQKLRVVAESGEYRAESVLQLGTPPE